jgi:hypothetical protein
MLALLIFALLSGAAWGLINFGFVGAAPFLAMLLVLAALRGAAGLGASR